MDLDPVLLSRLQFAFTIAFHILFPALTIGLASWLAVVEALWLKTGRTVYRRLYRFWVKVFAVSFGMGVVSGIVMSYQFGTNWSGLTAVGGNILGPLLSYEVVTAFFLEASFLGIMLFGWNKVGPRLHFLATCMVAIGTLISTFWILSANSWMQTPAGYALVDGQFVPTDWWAIVFNPSFPYRLVHMVLAAYLTTAFVLAGVSAVYLLRGRAVDSARISFSMALWFIAIIAPAQILAGDLHGLNTFEHQPAKVAAMEGHWETRQGAPLILFAWPDAQSQSNLWEVSIPNLGSLILTHEWDGEVPGLDQFAEEDRPPVAIVFWSFRLMVAIGLAMLAVGLTSLWLRWRGRLYRARWFHRVCAAMTPSGFVAVLAGWVTTEVGRQPWVVQGLIRTADAATPSLSGGMALTSLVLFIVVYAAVFGAGTYYLIRLLAKGPEAAEADATGEPGTPKRPMSAAPGGSEQAG